MVSVYGYPATVIEIHIQFGSGRNKDVKDDMDEPEVASSTQNLQKHGPTYINGIGLVPQCTPEQPSDVAYGGENNKLLRDKTEAEYRITQAETHCDPREDEEESTIGLIKTLRICDGNPPESMAGLSTSILPPADKSMYEWADGLECVNKHPVVHNKENTKQQGTLNHPCKSCNFTLLSCIINIIILTGSKDVDVAIKTHGHLEEGSDDYDIDEDKLMKDLLNTGILGWNHLNVNASKPIAPMTDEEAKGADKRLIVKTVKNIGQGVYQPSEVANMSTMIGAYPTKFQTQQMR